MGESEKEPAQERLGRRAGCLGDIELGSISGTRGRSLGSGRGAGGEVQGLTREAGRPRGAKESA